VLYFKSYTIYSLQESVMIPILISHILRTNLRGLDNLFMDKGKIYTFLNPVSYLMALDRKDLFGQFDGIFADGSILVAAIRLLYGITVKRRSFDMTSMAPELFRFAENNGKMLYIVASKQEQVEKAVEIFKERYPKLKFMGCRNGYFVSEQEMDAEAKHITQVNPDFLIVGMGALMQERFLLKVRNAGFQGIGFTCGGFIHQTANNEIEYYPLWIDRMNRKHTIFRHDNFIGCFSADKIKMSTRKYFCFNIPVYKNMAEESSCRRPYHEEYIQTSASGNLEGLYRSTYSFLSARR